MSELSVIGSKRVADTDDGYPELERLIRQRVADSTAPLFTTAATGLFDVFLANLPEDRRQHYNCNCCRAFVEKYGGLVNITENGSIRPVVFFGLSEPDEHGRRMVVSDFFHEAVAQVYMKLCDAKITGVFYSSELDWGRFRTQATSESIAKKGVEFWTHLHALNPNVWNKLTQSADQAMAEKLRDYITFKQGLKDYPMEAVVQAVRVLEADALDRGEKTLGVAKWLLELQQILFKTNPLGHRRDNLIWRAVATAPPGWTHIRSTMISTLLDDIVNGLSYETIASRWAKKMHPLKYQRPTAPPAEGAIKQAEELVAKLGTAGAFARRYAKMEDVTAILNETARSGETGYLWVPSWEPAADERKSGDVFGHLKKSKGAGVKALELPAKTMTWLRFWSEILPAAREIQFLVPFGKQQFFAFTTAVNPDAPPIFQWDGLEGLPRNFVSEYVRAMGSYASEWSLASGTRVRVTAICGSPAHWQRPDKFSHFAQAAHLILEGAKEAQPTRGAAIFPETLRSEYHGIRSVIEAHSNSLSIAGREEATACGFAFVKPSGRYQADLGIVLTVRGADGIEQLYRIDRWE